MKKIYMLLGAFLMTFAASAQFVHQTPTNRGYVEKGQKIAESQLLPEDRETIYTNAVNDCSEWTFSNALDEGFTQFVDLQWECGNVEPTGFAAIDPIFSTTEDDGFLMVDSDLYGGEEGGTGVENCMAYLNDTLDFSGIDNVSLSFETFYRMWDGGASDGNEYCLVEFSTDGGMTWPDPTTNEVADADAVTPGMRYELWPDMGTQDPVNNPTLMVFILDEALGNQADVRVRFRWVGTWGYAWMIDDIEFFETPANDLTIVTGYSGDIIEDYNYASIPQSQTKDMSFGASMFNYGLTDQMGTEVAVEVDGPETYSGTLMVDLGSGLSDTLFLASDFNPSMVGEYEAAITVPSDDFPAGDTDTSYFEVTDFIYGHNRNDGLVARGFDQEYEYAIGNRFIVEEDAMLGALNIYFADGTVLPDGEVFEIGVYLTNDGDFQDNQSLGSAEISSDDLEIGNYKDYDFSSNNDGDGAIELFAGETYVVEVRKFFGDSRIYIASDAYDEDNSTINYGPFGADGVENWFFGYSWAPAVRMNLNEALSVDKLTEAESFAMSQNIPNPANDITRVNYTLNSANAVSLRVIDMTGREVMNISEGTQVAGEHSIEIDVRDLSSGVYTYTMTVGAETMTKQLIVK